MEEKNIKKVALIVIILGFAFLLFYTEQSDTDIVQTLDEIPAEEKVSISGVIEKVSVHEKVTFIKISGQQQIITDVVAFPDEELFLREGQQVEIFGMVENYKGKKEIIADKIVVR